MINKMMSQNQEQEEIKSDSAFIDEFTLFLKRFNRPVCNYKYLNMITALPFAETPVFYLDFNDLLVTDRTEELCDLLHQEPDRAISFLQEAVKSIISDMVIPESEEDLERQQQHDYDIPVRIKNWDEKRLLRDINTNMEGRLLTSDCVITRTSEKRPFIFSSVYICRSCSQIHISTKNELLKKCLSCEDKLILHKKRSSFIDSRFINVQELPEDLLAGHLPSKNLMRVFGTDLTKSDQCRPGTRVSVTYIVRFDYDTSTMHELKTADPLGIIENFGIPLKLVLEVNNIEKLEVEGHATQNLTDADVEKIERLKHGDTTTLERKLITSFAPHIYGHDVLKESILLLLAGASSSSSNTSSNTTTISIPTRGDMHILLVGNPGIAKSRLLEFAALISPRCIKTTGRGSTAAGLTAAVVKDDDGKMMLEAGAVVLGDLGLTVIDEFDKLRTEDRSALHEAMEQQTVTITKGGIMATMNSRTSILAAANPVYGAYDLFKSIADNTELPTSLISRFDLIYALPDIIDEDRDRNIARAMLKQHDKRRQQQHHLDGNVYVSFNTVINDEPNHNESESVFPIDFLAKYIYYVKNHHTSQQNRLTKRAEKLIEDEYTYLRKFAEKEAGLNVAKTITVTPRIVDALYRISVARSRLLLKDETDERDVQRAIFLIGEMYKSFGIDIEGGANMTLLHGAPLSKKNKNSIFYEVCNTLSEGGKLDMETRLLTKELIRTGRFTEMEALQMIQKAYQQGILDPRKGDTYGFNKDLFTQK